MPLVSFLMSNYKTPPAYLKRALDSMLAQTMTDFEAVIINDGVKDASYGILLEYAAKDNRIRLIENETNLGLAASLNKGIEQCRGKYIARMDTDDICYPERLQLQTEYMDANPDIMFSGAWADVFDDDENEIKYQWQPVMCQHEEYRIRLLFSNEPCLLHPTVFFRSDFLRNQNLLYSENQLYRYTEDYEMWTSCADSGCAGILEKPVIKYRNAEKENRITVRHAKEMERCSFNTQKKLFSRLNIDLTEEIYLLNLRMLSGRKPYDTRYKKWMNKILRRNKQYRIYDQKIMKKLFHERWYNIVYYDIAHRKGITNRLTHAFTMYPSEYLRFLKDMLERRKRKRHGK